VYARLNQIDLHICRRAPPIVCNAAISGAVGHGTSTLPMVSVPIPAHSLYWDEGSLEAKVSVIASILLNAVRKIKK